MSDEAVSFQRRGRGGRGSLYPTYTVQTMQQMGYLRWGAGRHSSCELILPGKLCSTTSADSIWNALCASAPALSSAQMHALSERIRAFMMYTFPDGHPSNRAVMQHMMELHPFALYLAGHCMSHLLQLVWDSGATTQIPNPLYGFVQ